MPTPLDTTIRFILMFELSLTVFLRWGLSLHLPQGTTSLPHLISNTTYEETTKKVNNGILVSNFQIPLKKLAMD